MPFGSFQTDFIHGDLRLMCPVCLWKKTEFHVLSWAMDQVADPGWLVALEPQGHCPSITGHKGKIWSPCD